MEDRLKELRVCDEPANVNLPYSNDLCRKEILRVMVNQLPQKTLNWEWGKERVHRMLIMSL
jgi:hypothetical protein